MAALRSRCGHYVFALWFLVSSICFISSPILSCRWLDVYHNFYTWCDHSANLECSSETCCTQLAGNAGPKIRQTIAIWEPLHSFVGLCLRNWGTYRQSEKNLLSSNTSPICPYNIVNFGLLAAEIISLVWGTIANFNGFRVLAALLHGTLVWTSAKLCGVEQRAPPIFGRAAITLGIRPHSS